MSEMEIKQERIRVRLKFLTRYSHKWTKTCSLYKYIGPNFQEFCVVHHVICEDLTTQKNL
jgi:hypothetical protein